MWSKIYFGVLAVAVVVMAFFTYYAWSWLQSIGQPVAAAEGYDYHSRLAWNAIWLFTIALLICGNAVLWASGRAWAMWATFLYFATVWIIHGFWLEPLFLRFNKASGLSEATRSMAPISAVVLIVLMAIIVFFDKFLVIRLRAKTYPSSVEPEAESAAEHIL